jgi:hypothetical protein
VLETTSKIDGSERYDGTLLNCHLNISMRSALLMPAPPWFGLLSDMIATLAYTQLITEVYV